MSDDDGARFDNGKRFQDKTWEETVDGVRTIHIDPNRLRAFAEIEAYEYPATDEQFGELVEAMAKRFGYSDADYERGEDA